MSTTTRVWEILTASYEGYLQRTKELAEDHPGLIYTQYNYTPPIHFAVREGHIELVKDLPGIGAYDPAYKTHPFQESLQTIAGDRGYDEIGSLLKDYARDIGSEKYYKGDNGEIHYNRTELQFEFERAVDKESLGKTAEILKQRPEFALDKTYFWSEGILTFAAKKE